ATSGGAVEEAVGDDRPRLPPPSPCVLCRDGACPELVEGPGGLISSKSTTAAAPVLLASAVACRREQTHNFASTCPATRAAKSADAASSIGTTVTPHKAHPKNAATHSAQFSPHNITRSPLWISLVSSFRQRPTASSRTRP